MNQTINEISIEELTSLLIKTDFEDKKTNYKNQRKYVITKEELIKFSIKLLKEIERYR